MRQKNRLTQLIQIISITLLLGLPFAGFTLNTGSVAAAPLAQAQLAITSPREGSTVSGQVQIIGTANHSNFGSYGVLYAPGPRPVADSRWVPLVFGVSTAVNNGVLATWDTTSLPNGQYTLALAVYENGSTEPNLLYTNNITVQNNAATPTPTPTATPEGGTTEATTPVPPGTALAAPEIQQPPTSTPRPTPTLAPEGVTTDESSSDGGGLNVEGIFSVDKITEAAVLGVKLAGVFYLIGFLYMLAKAVIRQYFKQTSERPPGE